MKSVDWRSASVCHIFIYMSIFSPFLGKIWWRYSVWLPYGFFSFLSSFIYIHCYASRKNPVDFSIMFSGWICTWINIFLLLGLFHQKFSVFNRLLSSTYPGEENPNIHMIRLLIVVLKLLFILPKLKNWEIIRSIKISDVDLCIYSWCDVKFMSFSIPDRSAYEDNQTVRQFSHESCKQMKQGFSFMVCKIIDCVLTRISINWNVVFEVDMDESKQLYLISLEYRLIEIIQKIFLINQWNNHCL